MTNVITFRSRRRGFQRYIVGQLKECGSQFYHEEIYVRIQEDLSTNECESFIVFFHFVKQSFNI